MLIHQRNHQEFNPITIDLHINLGMLIFGPTCESLATNTLETPISISTNGIFMAIVKIQSTLVDIRTTSVRPSREIKIMHS